MTAVAMALVGVMLAALAVLGLTLGDATLCGAAVATVLAGIGGVVALGAQRRAEAEVM